MEDTGGDHSHLVLSRLVLRWNRHFLLDPRIYLLVGPFLSLDCLLGDAPRLRTMIGDRLGDLARTMPFSPSGDGDDPPPVAELRREAVNRTMVSRWRNLEETIKLTTGS